VGSCRRDGIKGNKRSDKSEVWFMVERERDLLRSTGNESTEERLSQMDVHALFIKRTWYE
jgi:hypothetical protein